MHRSLSAPVERAAEVKFHALDVRQVSLDGTFEGYASIFNRRDLGGDVVLPGAFKASLKARGTGGVRMLFQHDPAQPIGVWERLYEDARGLYARGRLTTEVAKAREVLALMRSRAIDGLSIGFRAVKGRRDSRSGSSGRALAEIDLWEISVVTFPMLPEARVTSVKASAFAGTTPTEREFERWLTQDAGFTRTEARAVMRDGLTGLKALRDARQASGWQTRLAAQMATAAHLLRQPPSNRTISTYR
ncbi:MAG: HK97 family phage prohead protease [Hyphomicrobiaceae bacterium]